MSTCFVLVVPASMSDEPEPTLGQVFWPDMRHADAPHVFAISSDVYNELPLGCFNGLAGKWIGTLFIPPLALSPCYTSVLALYHSWINDEWR